MASLVHCRRTHVAFLLLFIFTDKLLDLFISQALLNFNSSFTFPVTLQIPLLSFLLSLYLILPWMSVLQLALRRIPFFSLSSRKGMGTEQHGEKKKGGERFPLAGRKVTVTYWDLLLVLYPPLTDNSCKSINLHKQMFLPALCLGCFKQIPHHPYKRYIGDFKLQGSAWQWPILLQFLQSLYPRFLHLLFPLPAMAWPLCCS